MSRFQPSFHIVRLFSYSVTILSYYAVIKHKSSTKGHITVTILSFSHFPSSYWHCFPLSCQSHHPYISSCFHHHHVVIVFHYHILISILINNHAQIIIFSKTIKYFRTFSYSGAWTRPLSVPDSIS